MVKTASGIFPSDLVHVSSNGFRMLSVKNVADNKWKALVEI